MAYPNPLVPLSADKRAIFASKTTTSEIKAQVKLKAGDYRFLSQNRSMIEHDFNQMYSVLSKKGANRQEFWHYCYYCCLMLKAYYKAYDNGLKAAEYKKLAAQIRDFCETGISVSGKKEPKSFIVSLGTGIAADLTELANSPRRVTTLRQKIGLLNIYRIYWAFCRMTLNSAFSIAANAGWIDGLNKLLGKKIDTDKIAKTLQAPNIVLNALSVGFFAARFLLNAGMVVKHTFFPTEKEAANTSKWQRFCSEMRKRHPDFMNDVVWGTINGVCNYAQFFHIIAPVAGWLTAGFLFFDVGLLLWRRRLAQQDYTVKKTQYIGDMAYLAEQQRLASTLGAKDWAFEQYQMVEKQLVELDITWQAKNATYLFNVSAALILAAGFSASMVFAPGVLAFAAYAACVLAVAMYLSDAEYHKYKECSLRLQHAKLGHEDTSTVLAEYKQARSEFWCTLAKNAILPGLIIAAYAICWQAALIMTAVYLSYQLWKAYSQHKTRLAANDKPTDVMTLIAANDEGSEAFLDTDEQVENSQEQRINSNSL